MLFLSRKLNEKIIIGEVVVVEVVGLEGGRVKLAITAPRDVPVHRSEVLERIERAKTSAEISAKLEGAAWLNETLTIAR